MPTVQKMEYLQAIKKLYESDVDIDSEDVFGFHGTSIEAISYLAIHGRMPTTGLLGTDFHFTTRTTVGYDPYDEARKYAGINGFRNILLAELKAASVQLDSAFISDILLVAEEGFKCNPDIYSRLKACLKFKYDHHFDRHIESLRSKRKGVIIGVKKRILDLKPFSGVDEDLVVKVSNGLPIDYISGIDAIGKF